MPNLYAVLADVTVTVHAAFVAFVVGAQVLILIGWPAGWGWTRRTAFRAVHVAAIGLVVLKTWLDVPCALTVLENALRTRSGFQPYELLARPPAVLRGVGVGVHPGLHALRNRGARHVSGLPSAKGRFKEDAPTGAVRPQMAQRQA
jgi:hypothetical protein